MDVKPLPAVTVQAMPTPADSTPSSPTEPKAALATYRTLVGDIDSQSPSPSASLYHTILAEERNATRWFYLTAALIYFLIVAQIVLCLCIILASQKGLHAMIISAMAAVNTVVAAGIGLMKGLGLPDKKDTQRLMLRGLVSRIQVTTRKMDAGLHVDAVAEADNLRTEYEGAATAARIVIADGIAAAESGLAAGKTTFGAQLKKL